VTRNDPLRFELPSDEYRYTPFFNVTVQVMFCFLATLVDLSRPAPRRWKLSFVDLSLTKLYLPALSFSIFLPSSLRVRNEPAPTVA